MEGIYFILRSKKLLDSDDLLHRCIRYSSSRLYSALQIGSLTILIDDDDGVVGELSIFVCQRSKIESVSSLHLSFVGLFVVTASRTKRAWQPKTFPK